ncbi:hypothetical protein [Nonomuraea rosea]|uniref:hypothetical protein n=1 Tax=Nonomuraea rosea TaxID=638574 RepID=UPI0031EA9FF3
MNLIVASIMGVLLLAGIVVMAMRRRDHGRAAILGMFGCILLLLRLIVSTLLAYLAPMLFEGNLEVTFAIANIITLLLDATGTGLLIWAVVARRPQQQPAQPQGPGWQQPPGDWQQQHPQQDWNQPPQQPPFQQPPGWQPPPRPPFGEGQG